MAHGETGTTDSGQWPDGDGPLRAGPAVAGPGHDGALLVIDVDGFEGPLDLLLNMARTQKVDITRISILDLAEQYLKFIHEARRLRLEIAADYLVMAAWLAYLKSRLLLPPPHDDEDEVPAEELAARLAFRLQRLQAMREAGAQLMARNRLGRDVFARGQPEPLVVETTSEYTDNLIDLLKAYAGRRQKAVARQDYEIRKLTVWSVKEARQALERLVGTIEGWAALEGMLAEYLAEPQQRTSIIASSFSASLELVREGVLEIRQEMAFRPVYVRRRQAAAAG